MRIGVLGAGEVAQAFARHALAAGHEVVLSNRRGPESLGTVVRALGPGAAAARADEAADLPLVLLAIPWLQVEACLRGLSWRGQVLVDATNAFGPEGEVMDLGGRASSEVVASLAPGARVVKALNSLFMSNYGQERTAAGLRRVVFLSGDDRAAVAEAGDLFQGLGFAPVNLGSLAQGGRMQAVGSTLAGHDFHLPWPAPRSFPAFNGEPP